MEIKLIVGAKYAVSTDSVCRVTYMRDGQEREYTTAYAGQQGYFVAQSSVAYVDDENADITLFTDAPSVLVLLRGGGNTDGLPAGYTRVEYFETDGTNYIDTLIGGVDFAEVETKLLSEEPYGGQYKGFWGFSDDLIGNMGFNMYLSYANHYPPDYVWITDWCTYAFDRDDWADFLLTPHVFKYTSDNGLYIDGEKQFRKFYGGVIEVENPSELSLFLGGFHHHFNGKEYLRFPSKAKFYSWKLWNNAGELVADLIPVRRTNDGYPGMWCKVRKLFLPLQYWVNATILSDEDLEQLKELESGGAGVGAMAL